MSTTRCTGCGALHEWTWTDAFNKFGFEDGDGLVMTPAVVSLLTEAGYQVETSAWGLHNVIITSIFQDGVELIPGDAKIGYDNPRNYLPKEIIALLDEKTDAIEDAEGWI